MQATIDEERQEADRRLTSSSNEVSSPSLRKLDKRIDLSATYSKLLLVTGAHISSEANKDASKLFATGLIR